MNYNDFNIQFVGLKDGIHNFVFEIGKTFFDLFEYSDLNEGRLKAEVELNKTEQMLTFNIFISGYIELVCDYCLENFNYPLNIKNTTYVKFGDDYDQQDNNLIIINRNDTSFDLGDLLYQLIVVNIPLKRVHPSDENGELTCNKEMLEKLDDLLIYESKNDRDENLESNWKNELKKLKNGTS